jgi:hypothetical protein
VAAVVTWSLAFHVWPARAADADDLAPNTAGPGLPANGASSGLRKRAASMRGLARGVTHLDRVLTFGAASFFLFATAAGAARMHDPSRFRYKPLAVAGSQAIAYVGAVLVAVMWAGRKKPKVRKSVGIVWDLLTFWPRRYHPFAVRPYSEQAVPEIRGRLFALAAQHERVLISAHSQGTVLAYAALAPLADSGGDPMRVTLVTYGSPIGGLYRMAFPTQFSDDAMLRLRDRLQEWRNFRRLTDPIGSDIAHVPTVVLADPGVTPSPDRLRHAATPAERDRIAWTAIAGHSFYRSEPVLKRAIDDLRYSP